MTDNQVENKTFGHKILFVETEEANSIALHEASSKETNKNGGESTPTLSDIKSNHKPADKINIENISSNANSALQRIENGPTALNSNMVGQADSQQTAIQTSNNKKDAKVEMSENLLKGNLGKNEMETGSKISDDFNEQCNREIKVFPKKSYKKEEDQNEIEDGAMNTKMSRAVDVKQNDVTVDGNTKRKEGESNINENRKATPIMERPIATSLNNPLNTIDNLVIESETPNSHIKTTSIANEAPNSHIAAASIEETHKKTDSNILDELVEVDSKTIETLNSTNSQDKIDDSHPDDFEDMESTVREDLDQMSYEPELTDCDKEIDGWVEGTLEQVVSRIADSLDDTDSNKSAKTGTGKRKLNNCSAPASGFTDSEMNNNRKCDSSPVLKTRKVLNDAENPINIELKETRKNSMGGLSTQRGTGFVCLSYLTCKKCKKISSFHIFLMSVAEVASGACRH